jgi:hypothetical protein
MQQVICMRCGAQFRVAGAGPVYCPNCGVLLGPAPATGAAPAQAAPGPNAGPAVLPPSGTPIRMASPASPAASPVPGAAPPTTPLPPGMGQSGVAPPGYAPPSVPLGGTYGMPGAATSPLYGYSAVTAASQVAAQASARGRRRTWLLITTLALLVVLLVAGSGVVLALAMQQPNTTAGQGGTSGGPTPAITVPAGFVEFTDPGGVFACGVPSGWVQVSSTAGNVTSAAFGSASQQATLSVQYIADDSLGESDLDDQLLQALPATLHNGKLANVAKGSAATFGRETWAVKTADLTYSADSGSVTLHVVVMTASRDVATGSSSSRHLFSLIAMAPASSFETINRQDFAPLQASFTFLR